LADCGERLLNPHQIQVNWLLAEDVFPSRGGRLNDFCMSVGGRANCNGLDVRRGEHLMKVSRGQRDVELASHVLSRSQIHIGHAGQSRTANTGGEILRVNFADSAGPDDSEIDGFSDHNISLENFSARMSVTHSAYSA